MFKINVFYITKSFIKFCYDLFLVTNFRKETENPQSEEKKIEDMKITPTK